MTIKSLNERQSKVVHSKSTGKFFVSSVKVESERFGEQSRQVTRNDPSSFQEE